MTGFGGNLVVTPVEEGRLWDWEEECYPAVCQKQGLEAEPTGRSGCRRMGTVVPERGV